jgi:uncharacterized protein
MSHSNTQRPRSLIRCAALVLLASLAGCNVIPPPQDDATRYFVLSDSASPESPAQPAPAQGGLRLGLRAIRLEGYLKNRSMVVRSGPNEIRFEDYRRWADPVDAAISRVLRSSLLAAPSVARVFTEPFPFDQARDYDVSIEVTRFEGALSGGKYEASVSATIEISTTGPNSRVVSRRNFEAPAEAWDGADFGQLAALLNRDVAALAQEVVAEVPARE